MYVFCDCTCWASKKFLPGGMGYLEGLEGCLTGNNSWWEFKGDDGVGFEGLFFSTYFPFTYLPMIFPSLSKYMMSQGLLSAVPFLNNYLECGRLSEFLLFLFFLLSSCAFNLSFFSSVQTSPLMRLLCIS